MKGENCYFFQVALSVDGVETIFLVLSRYSSPGNVDWRTADSLIPVTEPTEATVCGFNRIKEDMKLFIVFP